MDFDHSAESLMLQKIVSGLNRPPFNKDVNLVRLDSMSSERLLQTLSDVLCWIQGSKGDDLIDIRSESPDETTMRILSILRILRYPPPRDIDAVQKWRLDLLEGQKDAIYPILAWVFDNVDHLKERIYLASFLTRIEVPIEAQTPETNSLIALIELKMNEFKATHSKIVETRMDHVRVLEIQGDLKAMAEEKEQLSRRVERHKRKLARVSDLEHLLDLTKQYRQERDRADELRFQLSEQKNSIANIDRRLNRLEQKLLEEQNKTKSEDPRILITNLKREVEVNRYLIEEKLAGDINTQKKNIEVVQKVLSMKNATKEDITRLKKKIDELNAELSELSEQRDRRDEASEDKLTVYRHQAANVQKKKANIADQLQSAKHDLDAIEGVLVARKRELAEKAGTDEVVTSVQYKLYANEMRMKLKTHRRMEIELEQIKAEESTLEQTVELLEKRFKSIKEENRAEGQAVIETLDLDEPSLRPRPKTAKPTTSDVDDLKLMIERLSAQIGEKRTEVQQLNTKVNEIEKVQKEENDTYMAAKNEFEQIEAMITGEVEELNKRKVELEKRLNVSTEELKTNKELIERQHWLFEQTKLSADQLLVVCQNLERHGTECQQQIQKVSGDISELSNRKDLAEQMQMWQKLLQIFETKLRLSRANDSSNAGVGTIAAPNDEQQRDIRPIGDKF